ncbi:hypothetical protein KVT40_004087 [Elsinoe batatas]|uniref:Uncharacterized protein n=1 Tax=Elsinoe batatas TaxID=2601811 RepID=A0A8K0PJX3_9PEZI|nr:hypothetical protein KVT40_004087 [Elsinoe batatas]
MHYHSLPLFAVLASLGTSALAKDTTKDSSKDGGSTTTSGSGDFAVTLNGITYNPAPGKSAKAPSKATCRDAIQVRGIHVSYDIDCTTLSVNNYTLTGAASPERMVTSPTVIFTSKTPSLTPAQRSSSSIKDFDLQDDVFVIIFSTPLGKLKIQSKDAPQGGIFQMETEFASDVEFVHTLGPEVFYFKNSVTGKINFGNGIDAVAAGEGQHRMLLGKDSPQVATKTYQDGRVTKWLVKSGGRMGGVLGEDATEASQGASNCTSDCQAQNRIKGSVPASDDPENPQPLRIKGRRVV